MKTCERCQKDEAKAGRRFCEECEKAIKAEMEQVGYLTRTPGVGPYRSSEMRENTYETKHGRNG